MRFHSASHLNSPLDQPNLITDYTLRFVSGRLHQQVRLSPVAPQQLPAILSRGIVGYLEPASELLLETKYRDHRG